MDGNIHRRVVAFIDILGFKDIVENSNRAFAIIKTIEELKKEQEKNFKDIDVEDVEITWFSDCIVMSSPLDIEYIELLLFSLQHMQLSLLDNGILIRGGVTYGECFHKENKLFGKAMNEAYLLECKIALVPRIVLSKGLVEYINNSIKSEEPFLDFLFDYENNFEDYSEEDDIYSEVSTGANIFRAIITKDIDSYYFVDYINLLMGYFIHTKDDVKEGYLNKYDGSFEGNKSHCEEGVEFCTRIRDIIEKNNKVNEMGVILKYKWLRDYHNKTVDKYKNNMSKEFLKEYYEKYIIN
jgi:hypothetical protein